MAPRVGTMVWGALVVTASVLLILNTVTGLKVGTGQLLAGALVVIGAALVTAGILAIIRRS